MSVGLLEPNPLNPGPNQNNFPVVKFPDFIANVTIPRPFGFAAFSLDSTTLPFVVHNPHFGQLH